MTRIGKIGTYVKVPLNTTTDLGKYYTPGVAEECKEIHANPALVTRYTNISNRVLVVSDGTATLGLGDIGHLASKPVMEGKVALMGRLAGIDAVDLVCAPAQIEQLVKAVAPNFGAINIEDVAAPRCFGLTDRLNNDLDVLVFHDDQDGTAVVVCAAIKRALRITGRRAEDCKVVIAGAGAGAQATARLLIAAGVPQSGLFMFDSHGLLTTDRALDPFKMQFAQTGGSLSYEEALVGADIFVGLSRGGIIDHGWMTRMAPRPIVLALANPIPEVDTIQLARLRPDAIIGTGRSGDPNQVNNLLCFPFLLRGLLDTKMTRINQTVLLAFADALASLETEALLPSPFDWRLLFVLAPEVARIATLSGLAYQPIHDLDQYRWRLLFGLLGIECKIPARPFPGVLPATGLISEIDNLIVQTYVRYGPPLRQCFTGREALQQLGKLDQNPHDYIAYGMRSTGGWEVVGGSNLGLLTAWVCGPE
jgi:malate dehydrogenase (oxaloacetate-decarboxylating)(NADP+)